MGSKSIPIARSHSTITNMIRRSPCIGTTPGEHGLCSCLSLASARQLLIHNPRKSGEMGRRWPESSVAGLSNRVFCRLRGTPRQPGQPRMGPCATLDYALGRRAGKSKYCYPRSNPRRNLA